MQDQGVRSYPGLSTRSEAPFVAAPRGNPRALLQRPEFGYPVLCIEPFAFDEARSQAYRHGGIVGPLARLQTKGAATDYVGSRRKCPVR